MNPSPAGAPERAIPLLPLLLLATVILFWGIGLRAPWPADEPRFAQIAREMVESGQWLFPTRGGELYPDKPPVFVWLVALLYLATGHLKVAFLLPSALAGLGTMLMVCDIGRRLWGADTARSALLVLLMTPHFLLQAKTAQLDALVSFWITLGCYGLLRHFLLGPAWGWYLTAFAAMALGIMTKGVGILPALMLIPLALWGARAREHTNGGAAVWSARAWLGPLVLLGTLALWLGPMLWQVAASHREEMRAYRDNILLRQTAGRYANPWGHIKPWHYFLTQALPTVWFPLTLMLLMQARRLVRVMREDARARILFAWVVLVLLFFSISPGKREVYILPALPMAALGAAVVWERALAERDARWTTLALRLSLLAGAIALVVLGAIAWHDPTRLGERADDYADALADLALPLMALGLVTLVAALLTWRRAVIEQWALTTLAGWVVVAGWIWPVLNPHRTPQALLAHIEDLVPSDHEVGLIRFKEQFLLFSPRPLVHFSVLDPVPEQERNAWRWMRERPGRVVLVPASETYRCLDLGRARLLGTAHREDWLLVDATALAPTCEAPRVTRLYHWAPQRRDILD